MTPIAPALRIAATALLTGGAGAARLAAVGVGAGDSLAPDAGGVSVSPEQGQDFPYIEVQGTTEVETGRSDQTRTSSVTLTLNCRAVRRHGVERLANVVVDLLAGRFEVPDALDEDDELLHRGGQMTDASLDLYADALREPPPGARPWSLPVRLRYTLIQSADPGE